MIWLLLIPLIVLWAFLQKHGNGQSRGSMRYQRRKARTLGIETSELLVNHRGRPVESKSDWLAWTRHPLAWLLPIGLWALLFGEPVFDWIRRLF